jgi:hypothetical protein
MSEGGKDLFGKIDALFEKRAPDALVDKGLAYEDFPVLTEVVGRTPQVRTHWGDAERRVSERRAPGPAKPPAEERRVQARRAMDKPPPSSPSSYDPAGRRAQDADQVPGLEARLADLFIRQQLRLEEIVRKTVREELDKRFGPGPGGATGEPRR